VTNKEADVVSDRDNDEFDDDEEDYHIL